MNKYMYFSEFWLENTGIFERDGKRYIILMIVPLVINISAIIGGIAELSRVTDDFQLVAELVSAWLLSINAITRFNCLIINRKKMIRLRHVVKTGKVSGGQLSEADDQILSHYDRLGLRFCRIYSLIALVVSVSMLLQPIPGMLIFGHQRKLPFPIYYPFNTNTTIGYLAAYVHEIMSGCAVIIQILSFDSWFIFLLHHTSSNLHLLQNWLEKITETEQHRVHEKIVRCIRLHQNAYKFAADLEEVFNRTVILLFLVTTVNICISGYALTRSGSQPQLLVKHFSAISGQILQALLLNWCGQLIEDKASICATNIMKESFILKTSVGVSLAVSRAKLYELKLNHQKDLGLLMMIRSQTPISLTAGKFYNLSLVTFTNVRFRSMYSAYQIDVPNLHRA
ncbi:odorant receptor 13a-like [Diprion similis]|uniref:odorant receptor 13a-like n=1 Tax=Diprion similis TaxID=362088 RepID=UPI001EF7D7A8|nr:odorant receptor 13a-like [Diprion similis]